MTGNSLAIAALALCACAAAGAALAQSTSGSGAASASAAAPAIVYVSPCPTPALEPYPTILDPATAKGPALTKAKGEYADWTGRVKTYLDCKQKEFAQIDTDVDALKASSPAVKMVSDYNAITTVLNKATDAEKAAGVPTEIKDVQLTPKGQACPPTPAITPAPEPPAAPADPHHPDRKALASANEAYQAWAKPYVVYLMCVRPQVQSKITDTNAALKPYADKKEAAAAEYNAVVDKAKAFNDKWTAFATAYNARLKSTASH